MTPYSPDHSAVSDAAKGVWPAGAVTAHLAGIDLPTFVYILTAMYTVCMIAQMAYRFILWLQKRKKEKIRRRRTYNALTKKYHDNDRWS